jgi:hypothetical protein
MSGAATTQTPGLPERDCINYSMEGEKMKFRRIYVMNQFKDKFICTAESGEWVCFDAVPVRTITEKDIHPYKGNKPVRENGSFVDSKHYGRLAYEFEVYGYGIEAEKYMPL